MLEYTRHCIIYLHFNHQKVEEFKWLYTPGPRRFGQWVGLAPPFLVPKPLHPGPLTPGLGTALFRLIPKLYPIA